MQVYIHFAFFGLVGSQGWERVRTVRTAGTPVEEFTTMSFIHLLSFQFACKVRYQSCVLISAPNVFKCTLRHSKEIVVLKISQRSKLFSLFIWQSNFLPIISEISWLPVEQYHYWTEKPYLFLEMELGLSFPESVFLDGFFPSFFQSLLLSGLQIETFGIQHHDIKPTNILISSNNEIILGDYDFASMSVEIGDSRYAPFEKTKAMEYDKFSTALGSVVLHFGRASPSFKKFYWFLFSIISNNSYRFHTLELLFSIISLCLDNEQSVLDMI